MSMTNPAYSLQVPHLVSAWVPGFFPLNALAAASAPSSGTFLTANTAYYTPLWLPITCPVRRLFWINGSTVSASYNVDIGIYASSAFAPSTRLTSSGSTAQGTASQLQFVDVTDLVLAPGLYWMAITCSSASATFFRDTTGLDSRTDVALGYEEASALPLPATATPIALSESSPIFIACGFATTASP